MLSRFQDAYSYMVSDLFILLQNTAGEMLTVQMNDKAVTKLITLQRSCKDKNKSLRLDRCQYM